MIIRELITRLGFDADNNAANKHENALKNVRRAAVGLTAAYAATVGAVTAFTARIAGVGDEIAKTSRLVGLGTDDLQAWRYAAGQTGVSTGTLDSSLRSFTRRLGAAADGTGPAAETLEKLGIATRNADGSVRSVNDVLPEAADRIAALGSEAEKANAAQNLFNASGRQMVLWLDQGSEGMALARERFEAMGGAMSAEGTARSEALSDALDDVNVIVRSLSFRIGEQLMPMVTETALAMRDWYIRNRDLITQNLKRFIEVLTFAIRTLWNTLRFGFKAIDSLVDKFGGWERVLRIVMAAVLGFIALKLGGVLWAIAGALTGAGAGAHILRAAMMALTRIPIVALMVALGLVIEDLIVWINGGDSAIGRWLGSWEEFSAKIKPIVDKIRGYLEALNPQFAAMGEVLAGALTVDPARTIRGLNTLGDEMIIWVMKVGGDIADYLMEALTPDTDAIMAAMRQLGQDMLDWAKGVGRAIAEALIPQAALKFMGGRQDPGDEEAPPAPDGTSAPADPLVLPPSEPTSTPAERMSGAFNTPTPEQVQQNVSTSNTNTTRNVSVNARIESTLQVPLGTPQEQQAALRREAESTFNELFNRELSRTLNDMPETN